MRHRTATCGKRIRRPLSLSAGLEAAYGGVGRLKRFRSKKSRAPKLGIWLERGAQPATSAGARLLAGSPIPALLPSSMGRYRDQKKEANLKFLVRESQTLICV